MTDDEMADKARERQRFIDDAAIQIMAALVVNMRFVDSAQGAKHAYDMARTLWAARAEGSFPAAPGETP